MDNCIKYLIFHMGYFNQYKISFMTQEHKIVVILKCF